MLNQDYLNQVQKHLTDYFKNNIDKHDDHHVSVYPSLLGDDGYITYTPNWLDNHNDNDGQIMPIRHVIVKAIANHDEWTILVNQQFIHAQKFTENVYDLNLNYRHDNGISKSGAKRLAQDLKQKFNIHLSKTGLLVSKVNPKVKKSENLVFAFSNMVKAIQFVNNNGFNYTDNYNQSKSKHPVSKKAENSEADKSVNKDFNAIKHADHVYHTEKRKHAGKSRKPKKHFTLGKVHKAYSSTNGTPWQRDKQIRQAKRKKQAKKNELNHKFKSKESRKSSSNIVISNHNFATCGRFSVATSKIKKFIINHGGSVQNTVNSKTNYLVSNKPSKSKKYQEAKNNGNVKIISESDLSNSTQN